MENNEPKNLEEIHKERLSSFAKSAEKMVATNDNAYKGYQDSIRTRYYHSRDYTDEELERIIKNGSLAEQQKLSRNYFYKDGYYKQILIYYATLLKYAGVLIPSVSAGKDLSTPHISKRYYNAIDFVDKMQLPQTMTNWALRALVDGSYYGVIVQMDKSSFALLDLPAGYAQSRFKDVFGNDIVEFDLTYFDTILDETAKEQALQAYPECIRKAYKNYHKGLKNKSVTNFISQKWFKIPVDVGVCFPFFDGRPLFLSVIPASISYKETTEAENEKALDEIRKIIIQQIPHLSDGRLLFEPDEAEEIHKGTVGMMRGNKNVSVLTTYADVDVAGSRANIDNSKDLLDRSEQDIYAQAGISREIFTAKNSISLEYSLKNDMSLMMYLAGKFSNFVTNIINRVYGNSNISFKYTILPISYYNSDSFIDSSFKLVGSGYSFLLPSIALGINQKDLLCLKDLENNLLGLKDKLIPLQTAYTQSSKVDNNESGRPSLEVEQKSEKTIENIQSQGNQ